MHYILTSSPSNTKEFTLAVSKASVVQATQTVYCMLSGSIGWSAYRGILTDARVSIHDKCSCFFFPGFRTVLATFC